MLRAGLAVTGLGQRPLDTQLPYCMHAPADLKHSQEAARVLPAALSPQEPDGITGPVSPPLQGGLCSSLSAGKPIPNMDFCSSLYGLAYFAELEVSSSATPLL